MAVVASVFAEVNCNNKTLFLVHLLRLLIITDAKTELNYDQLYCHQDINIIEDAKIFLLWYLLQSIFYNIIHSFKIIICVFLNGVCACVCVCVCVKL